MDKSLLDQAGWTAFDDLAGDISAPECFPIGSTHGSDRNGSRCFKDFAYREYDQEELKSRDELATKLIDELLAEMKADGEI